ncbi:MAG: hypothetical protein ACLFVU_11100 [Phycisphaerae bacterium]
MLATWVLTAQILESAMLIAFGVSWPISILKSVRSKRVEGKSIWFLVMICLGYVCGVGSKLFRAHANGTPPEPTTALYALNGTLVFIDILLWLKYSRAAREAAQQS